MGSGARYDDLELEIEAYSMERTNEALLQKRGAETFQIVMGVAPMIPQAPWINWKTLFSKAGSVLNDPDLGSIVDIELANRMAGMEGGGQPGPSQARFSKAVGQDAGQGGESGTNGRAPQSGRQLAGYQTGAMQGAARGSQ